MDKKEFYSKRNAAIQSVKNLYKNEVARQFMTHELHTQLMLLLGGLEIIEFPDPTRIIMTESPKNEKI